MDQILGQFSPSQPKYLGFILILSFHVALNLCSALLKSDFPN
jgi:hypothetical protein